MFTYCHFLLWIYSLFEKLRLFHLLDQKFWNRDWYFETDTKTLRKWKKSQYREVLRRDVILWFSSFIFVYDSCFSLSILHIFLAIRLRSNRNFSPSELSQSSFCLGEVSQDLNWMERMRDLLFMSENVREIEDDM